MKTVSVRLQDDIFMQFRKHLLNKAVANGLDISMDGYIRQLIINDMNNTQPLSTPASPPAVAPIVESSQRLNLSDLDW